MASDIASIIRDNQKEFRASVPFTTSTRVLAHRRQTMQEREERLRDTAESNNCRTMFFTICKIALCVGIFGFTQVRLARTVRRAKLLTHGCSQFNTLAAALKKRNS